MFHIAKKIYIETDNNLIPTYNGIIVSAIYGRHVYISDPGTEVVPYTNIEDLLSNFNNSLNTFWETVLSWEEKHVIYLEVSRYLETVVVYLKRLFPNATVDDLYFIYKSKLESERIDGETSGYKIDEGKNLSKKEFESIYKQTSKCNYFHVLSNRDVGFEYLLLNTDSPEVKEEVSNRFKYFINDLFIRKVYSFKESILRSGHLAYKLDPSVGEKTKSLDEFIRTSEKTKWVYGRDKLSSTDKFIESYSKDFIKGIYSDVLSLESGDSSLVIDRGNEKLSFLNTYDLIDVVYDKSYEDLLSEVLSRKGSMTYLNNSFYKNTNYILLSWIMSSSDSDEFLPFKFNKNIVS